MGVNSQTCLSSLKKQPWKYMKNDRERERARNSDRKRELGDDIGEIVALKKRKWSRIAQAKGLCCQWGGF